MYSGITISDFVDPSHADLVSLSSSDSWGKGEEGRYVCLRLESLELGTHQYDPDRPLRQVRPTLDSD